MAARSTSRAPVTDSAAAALVDPVKKYLREIGQVGLLTAAQEVDMSKRIEAGLFAEHKLEGGGLDEAYRLELEFIVADGVRAKADFIEANLRLVVSVAKRYTRPGVELLDVVQEGNLGLIRGVEKFDYTKGYKFSTYAMWWIRQAIQRGLIDIARTVRLPVHIIEALSKLSRLTREWVQDHGGNQPTPEDLAPKMQMSSDKVEFLMELNQRPASFDEEFEVGLRLGDIIEDVDAVDVADLVSHAMLAELIHSVLDTLTPREARILAMRFGLLDGHPHTLDEIGLAIGVTRERIRQLEKQALSKLRHPDRAEVLLDFAS